jgi:peptidoglycan/xylan/chitin deacetylase (PgdA/CDA1 family)
LVTADLLRARGFVKTGVARALRWTGADTLLGTLAGARALPMVLGYHRVVESFEPEARHTIPALLVTVRMLEQQLDWIGRRCRFITLDELGERLAGDRDPAEPVAAVTFDDGYRDTYELAVPLLRRKGIPAAIFVVTGLVGTSKLQAHDRVYLQLSTAYDRWADPPRALGQRLAGMGLQLRHPARWHRLAATPLGAARGLLGGLTRHELDRVMAALDDEIGPLRAWDRPPLPVTWRMLADMQRSGVTVGSHTRSHIWLTRERPERLRQELVGSRVELERRLGTRIRHFAYPSGQFTRATARAVAAAGYDHAYTTCLHRDPEHPLLTIPRLLLWENASVDATGRFSPDVMSCHLNRLFELGGCDQDHAADDRDHAR